MTLPGFQPKLKSAPKDRWSSPSIRPSWRESASTAKSSGRSAPLLADHELQARRSAEWSLRIITARLEVSRTGSSETRAPERPVLGDPPRHQLVQRVLNGVPTYSSCTHQSISASASWRRGIDVDTTDELGLVAVEERVAERLVRLHLIRVVLQVVLILLAVNVAGGQPQAAPYLDHSRSREPITARMSRSTSARRMGRKR